MLLRQNNIAPTLVGLAALLVLAPVLTLLAIVLRAGIGSPGMLRFLAARLAPRRWRGGEASRRRGIWELLESFSLARLL